jgi:DNA-binding NarL/FixJ family response regulator
MLMRLLFTASDSESFQLMQSTLDSALCLTPLEVWVAEACTREELLARVDAHQDDIILLDWQVAGADTPALVREILQRDPLLRVVALLPEHQRQYRQLVWDAGACNGIPKEHMDQEWLSTVLCIMHRAMQREARFLQNASEG